MIRHLVLGHDIYWWIPVLALDVHVILYHSSITYGWIVQLVICESFVSQYSLTKASLVSR